jgi:hypothetical protein
MVKIDYKKKLKEYYAGVSTKEFTIVTVPPMNFLMIDGQGYPGTSQEYQDAMETLYPVSYTLKFMMKKKGKDYVVMPLEGLWYADDMTVFTSEFMEKKDEWKWTSMVMQPDFITGEMVEQAIEEVKRKKNPVSLPKLRFEQYEEGLATHILYFGSYSDEGPTIDRLHKFIDPIPMKDQQLTVYINSLKNKDLNEEVNTMKSIFLILEEQNLKN